MILFIIPTEKANNKDLTNITWKLKMKSTEILNAPIYSIVKKPLKDMRSLVWIAMATCCCATWMLITLTIMLYV